MAHTSALRARQQGMRKFRSLRLLVTALAVICVAVVSRVSSTSGPTWSQHALLNADDLGTLPWDSDRGSQRVLQSGGLNCEDAEASCRAHKEDGETTLAWNLLYWPLMLYAFYGLAIVCDDYFVASLERISLKLKLSEDVAGATFMAAGSSAPELFTSTVDVFWFENNVGVGTIVGSAVFNVLVIIALSASCSNQALHIDWKPLSRDCLFYFVSIGLLVWFTESEKSVAAWEAACLVGWYACYIAFMTRNKEIFAWVDSVVDRVQQARLDRARNGRLRRLYHAKETGDVEALARAAEAIRHHGDSVSHLSDLEEGSVASDSSNDVGNVILALADAEDDDQLQAESEYELMERRAALRAKFRAAVYAVMAARFMVQLKRALDARRALWRHRCQSIPRSSLSPAQLKLRATLLTVRLACHYWPQLAADAQESRMQQTADSAGAELEAGLTAVTRGMAQVEEDTYGRLAPAIERIEADPPLTHRQRIVARITAALSVPWNVLLGYTIPNCEEDRWRRWYLVTFMMSIVWIGILSAVLVETASRIGCTLGISTVVMGLTVLAAGTSIPDALGSIVVARDGMGNMAVSNAIGSNVFDICLGIGLPYFVKTALVSPGETVPILDTQDIGISIAILAGTVFIVWGALIVSRWRLTKMLGYVLLVCYALFVGYTLLKPSEC